jgi:hypothetical protein
VCHLRNEVDHHALLAAHHLLSSSFLLVPPFIPSFSLNSLQPSKIQERLKPQALATVKSIPFSHARCSNLIATIADCLPGVNHIDSIERLAMQQESSGQLSLCQQPDSMLSLTPSS